MHSSKTYCEEESFKTCDRSVCVIADLHKGKYSRLSIWLCLPGPKRHLFPYVCMYAQSVTSIYLRENCSALARQLYHFPAFQTGASILQKLLSQSHVQLPALKRQSLETAGRTRARRGSRVRRQRLGWKNVFHMVLLSDLCWLVFVSLWFLDLTPESPTNGEWPPEDPHIPPCVKGAALWLLWDQIKHQH